MRKSFTTLLLGLFVSAAVFGAARIERNVQEKIFESSETDLIPVIFMLNQQAEFSDVFTNVQNLPKELRRSTAVEYYKDIARSTQAGAISILGDAEIAGEAQEIRSLWIVNAIAAKVTPGVINRVANLSSVNYVHLDEEYYVLTVEPEVYPVNPTDEVTWSVLMVNGDNVWDLGFNGSGVIVGVIDTGVNYNHLDLADHMWDGSPTYPNHGWDFYNNDNDPYDDDLFGGHGSHCSGIVAGDGTAGTQTGIAPEAQIMAIKVLSGTGGGTESIVWDGMQFGVDNGADILSMSLGWSITSNPDKNAWRTTCNNVFAAGVNMAIAAGNEGEYQTMYPVPDNIRTPGNCPPAWHHPHQMAEGGFSGVVTVASTDQADIKSGFSSVGPCTWENISPWFDYPYAGGSQQGYICPDIAAPGSDITSCTNNGNDVYLEMSGTSMATPQIAGIMALLLDKDPSLTPEEINQILELTAVPKNGIGKDVEYGSGRVDALSAVNAVNMGTNFDIDFSLTGLGTPIQIPAGGGSFDYTFSGTNNETYDVAFSYWTMVTMPDGSDYGPVHLAPYQLDDGATENRTRVQFVPASAPNGDYTFRAYLGLYPDVIYGQGQFDFEKLNTGDGGEIVTGWDSYEIESGTEISSYVVLDQDSYRLYDAYPNPFNPSANIAFDLVNSGYVKLSVFDVRGREVDVLVDGWMSIGSHSRIFNADNMSSGIYFYTIKSGSFVETKKMIFMK